MKKIIQIIICFLVLFNFYNNIFAKEPIAVKTCREGVKVTQLEGTAMALCPGQKAARCLKVSDLLQEGCEVFTGDSSRMEIVFADKTVVRFAENTNFKLIKAEATSSDKRDVKIFMSLGKIWSNVRKSLGVKGGFEISSENAVAGVRGTVYRINVEDDKSALIKVYDGEVNVSAPVPQKEQKPLAIEAPKSIPGPTVIEGPKPVSMQEWIYVVRSMQQIYIKSDGKAEEPKEFTEEEDSDEWVDWNKERDNKLII
ncbi:MAG: hypothetical protein A2031_08480 [Deltaproteobacteria bacterium RBG_19FT_COMBO_43_11]|nr:MAG: hypothetical protein A2031_08480 [Deltaproteobacteria bacterium RBG_19FT_COMBO_43_11]